MQIRRGARVSLLALWKDNRAAQMVEFAVALPLIVLFVVGIFDFSGAFTLQQKLNNIARDAARASASDPGNDILAPAAGSLPTSINDAFQLVQNYLLQGHLSTCGIGASSAILGPSSAAWTFTGTSSTCPPGGLKIYINRGYFFPQGTTALPSVTCGYQSAASGQVTIIATCVSIQYAYKWRFGSVASIFGSSTILPTVITGTAVAMNED